MPASVLIVLVVELALAVLLVAAGMGWLAWGRRTAVRRRVIVNKLDDEANEGVLWARRGRLLVVRDAVIFRPHLDPVPLDGDVLIDRDMIEFVQVKPAGG